MIELRWRVDFEALVLSLGGEIMRETYSTVKENGYLYAVEVAEELRQKGYEIRSGPIEAMVPRGQRSDGTPILVPGYRIIVDDGRPPYVPIVSEQSILWPRS